MIRTNGAAGRGWCEAGIEGALAGGARLVRGKDREVLASGALAIRTRRSCGNRGDGDAGRVACG
jgi:hypothetical protein